MNTVKRIGKYLIGSRKTIIAVALMALVGSFAGLLIPYETSLAIDCIFPSGEVDMEGLGFRVMLTVILLVVNAALEYGFTALLGRVCAKMICSMREEGFSHLCAMPLSYFDSTSRGDIMSRFVNDIETVSEGLQQLLTQLLPGIVTCLGSLVMIFVIDWKIALVVLAISPLYFVIASKLAKYSSKYFKKQQQHLGDLTAHAEEYLGAGQVVRGYSLEDEAYRDFADIDAKLYDNGWKAQFCSALVNPTSRLVVNLTYAILGAAGCYMITGGSITLGLVSGILTYANHFAKPINELTGVLTQIQAASAAADRYFGMLDAPKEPDESDLPALPECEENVRFDGVSFGYTPEKTLIENLSLAIPDNALVAIVGPTGAGKTTLVNLLMRFYEPTDGKILIGENEIDSFRRQSVRDKFSMVTQDTWLFSASVKENIAFAKPDATDEEIIKAAKRASAHDFIKRLPDGYDTVIGDDGDRLSHGQRQLISIARVMMTDAPMLILDEATSSVDTMTELRIQKAFRTLMNGRTSFVIAHRLSTIRDADLILVMDNGDVVEKGQHESLMKQDGLYAKLLRAAAGEY